MDPSRARTHTGYEYYMSNGNCVHDELTLLDRRHERRG